MFAWQCILHKGYVYLIISGGLNTEYIWKNQFLRTLSWKMKFKQDLPEMQQIMKDIWKQQKQFIPSKFRSLQPSNYFDKVCYVGMKLNNRSKELKFKVKILGLRA